MKIIKNTILLHYSFFSRVRRIRFHHSVELLRCVNNFTSATVVDSCQNKNKHNCLGKHSSYEEKIEFISTKWEAAINRLAKFAAHVRLKVTTTVNVIFLPQISIRMLRFPLQTLN